MSPEAALALGVSAVVAAVVYWMFVVAGRRRRISASKAEIVNCSFCGKSQDEVRKLIAGPGVHICDGCIDLRSGILTEECDREAIGGESGTSAGDRTPSSIPALLWVVSGLLLMLLATL